MRRQEKHIAQGSVRDSLRAKYTIVKNDLAVSRHGEPYRRFDVLRLAPGTLYRREIATTTRAGRDIARRTVA
jgi:hypothetical protein